MSAVDGGTIVDFVVGNPDLTALTVAVVRAGLVDALNSDASLVHPLRPEGQRLRSSFPRYGTRSTPTTSVHPPPC
jgi:hypothetical protein